jgi:hypothetical protein
MSTNTLEVAYANGDIIDASHVNELTLALLGSFVGRDANGIPTSLQSLGSVAIPWGSAYITNLILNGSAVDVSLLAAPQNRIVSGATRSSSNQPQFLTPNGAAASFTIDGLTTNLVLDVNGVVVTASTDITKSGLTVGPSTTATCLVADGDAADQESTKLWGESGGERKTVSRLDSIIPVDTMGAEMQAFIGQMCVIKIAGVATEYALAFIESATVLSRVKRGYFTDSSGAPVNRTGFTNNDVITVLSTGWVFLENDGASTDVSYVEPVYAFTSPTSPSTADYWYDMSNETWKRYDGASWQIINRTLIGVVGIDSANCVCARSFDFFQKFEETNTTKFEIDTTEIAKILNEYSVVNVYGTEIQFKTTLQNWNITTDLAASADMYNATEQASTVYYLYLKDTGEPVISDISPYHRDDLLGDYHPHNPWRMIGMVYNDGSSNITVIWDENSENRITSASSGGHSLVGATPTLVPNQDLYFLSNGRDKTTIGFGTAHLEDGGSASQAYLGTVGGGGSFTALYIDAAKVDTNSYILAAASQAFMPPPRNYNTMVRPMGVSRAQFYGWSGSAGTTGEWNTCFTTIITERIK